jgi:HAD superfamily hydrolase (TIGR01549 family)
MVKKIKAVIFDFDGTIADTLPFTFEKIVQLSKKYRIKKEKDELIEKISQLTPQELIKEFKISWFKVPFILWEIKQSQKALFKEIDKIKIFPGIKTLLKELKKKGIKIYIYSSNFKKNIVKFLEKEKINQYFENVYVGRNLLGKDKDLLNILKKEGLKNDEVYYVADEIRDVLACQKVKIKMIGVLWGVAGERGLTKVKVDYLVKKPEEILSLLPTQFRPKRSKKGGSSK